jgi:hypothetical protein
MWASKADIARGIIADARSPGPNELSHRERVALVLSVFDADTIDFEEVYDYGVPLVCYQPHIVEAWRNLAMLQRTYVQLCYAFQWIDEDRFHHLDDYFHCVIRNIDWHIDCLLRGEFKPLYVVPSRDLYDGPDKSFR